MFAIIALLVILLLAVAFMPQPETPDPTKEDFETPTAKEGDPVGVVFGTVDIKSANTVWYGDIKATAIRVKVGK